MHKTEIVENAAGNVGAPLDVVIIGAGLSGLTAARDLELAGCRSFAVVEARNRVGGRVYNIDLGNGVISEGGGEWLSPGQTAIADLSRALGVDTFDTWEDGKTVYMLGDMVVPSETDHTGMARVSEITAKQTEMARKVPCGDCWEAPDFEAIDRLSVKDFMAQHELSPFEQFSYRRLLKLNAGAEPHEMGLLHQLATTNSRLRGAELLQETKPGAPEKRFVGGSQRLCIKMADMLGDKVRLSEPVRKIVGWDRDIVEVHTDRGVIYARQVIAALSPALCNKIVFDPPLPEGRAEMQRQWPQRFNMRKTIHVYSRPFWRDAGFNGHILPAEGPLLWCCDNSPPDGSLGVINAFVRVDGLSTDPTVAEKTISKIYAEAFGDEALHPIQFHDIDWGTVDPWSLSCTSPKPPGFITKWGRFLHPAVGRIIWSGTETADIWSSFMEGAVRAGHHAALRALGALTRN